MSWSAIPRSEMSFRSTQPAALDSLQEPWSACGPGFVPEGAHFERYQTAGGWRRSEIARKTGCD